MSEQNWLKINIIFNSIEEEALQSLGCDLFEYAAQGTQVQENKLTAYFLAKDFNQGQILLYLKDYNVQNFQVEAVKNQNWTALCEEMFQQVKIGKIKIVPVFEYQKYPVTPDILYIVPGMGFGSGHHPTTQMLIKALQQISLPSKPRILDFGTGSGILSVAALKLFPDAEILAVDKDPQAVLNAEDNLKVNYIDNQITLSSEDIKKLNVQFDLILANIYLEVLKNYQPALNRLLKPAAKLLASGITEDQNQEFKEVFKNWDFERIENTNGWCAYVLAK